MSLKIYKSNRRLYDSREGAYVTAEDVRLRVAVLGEKVVADTGDDATAQVLLSIINNDFKKGRLTAAKLREMVRSYMT